MKASEIMTEKVLSVSEDTSVIDAVKIMDKNQIGALIVQTPRPTFGIFTQRYLLTRVIAKNRSVKNTKIKDVMTETIKCAQVNDSIDDITRLMYDENVRYLPVMDGRKLVGIISNDDLFKVVFRSSEGYKDEVE